MQLGLHFVPGMFASESDGILARLEAGVGGLEIGEVLSGAQESAPGEGRAETLDWLGSVETGECRRARFEARVQQRSGATLVVETLGVHPSGRALVGLELETVREGVWTHKDFEMSLMSLAVSALAAATQGAALIGSDLGPVGVGIVRGTVPDQVRTLLSVLDRRVVVFLAAPDTAANLVQVPGYVRAPMAGLFEYRLA